MMLMLVGVLLFVVIVVVGIFVLLVLLLFLFGDVVVGKIVLVKCMVCYSFVVGQNKFGLLFVGIVGWKLGSIVNFIYLLVMKVSNLIWDLGMFDWYLISFCVVVLGIKMIFGGILVLVDWVNLIVYLVFIGFVKL